MPTSSIPDATVTRLVTYLRVLDEIDPSGLRNGAVTSEQIARWAQVSPVQVRKDFSYVKRNGRAGALLGTQGVGYAYETLREALEEELGLSEQLRAVIIGMGRLGHALVDYPGLDQYKFRLVAGFDVDEAKLTRPSADRLDAGEGFPVLHVRHLPEVVRAERIGIGFVTVPPAEAHRAAATLAEAGVRGILNFAPTVLDLDREAHGHVHVESVDFLAGLKRVAYYIKTNEDKESVA